LIEGYVWVIPQYPALRWLLAGIHGNALERDD